jgi:uncharacterized surface protein with fasciclin (FAS1) repeats
MQSTARLLVSGIAAALISAWAFAGHPDDRTGDNIVETAAEAGQFETLLAAAEAAGLASALAGDGPFTVFAPTDEAFGALPAGTVATLLEPENQDQLAEILKFHVISGRVGSDKLEDGATLETLAGARVTFTRAETGFTVEGARIVATDIGASNGIVHVIDRVIQPPRRMSRNDAVETIEQAIARGVPTFNHGNPERTLAVYAEAARTLIDHAPLTPGQRQRLERGLNASDGSHSSRASAWALRYALDEVLMSLHGGGQMMTNVR